NALQTLLPQIRVEIREEFRTGSGPLDSGGNPPPVTIHTWLKRFSKQKPRSFEKATAPVDAENWISHMEKIFDVMGCEDAFKTRLAVSTLNHLMCIPFTDVAQVANAAHNYEILHERDDGAERPDKSKDGCQDEVHGFKMFQVVKKLKRLKKTMNNFNWQNGKIFDKVVLQKDKLKEWQSKIDNDPTNNEIKKEDKLKAELRAFVMKVGIDMMEIMFQRTEVRGPYFTLPIHIGYGDDLMVFCHGDVKSVKIVKDTIHEYSFLWNQSKIRIGKSKLAWKMVCRPKNKDVLRF
nr:zinc finger, CCHC-type, retrotransposon Gag domain protein [Tanacetum cinerariifolium]